MQIPINEKSPLNLMHGFITFQIFLNTTKSFTIEIAISDTNNGKKRILFSACSKEFIKNHLHCRIPIINIPTGIWINFSVDILSFVSECFKGQSFRAIDSICISADCKIRRICGMRQLYTLSLEEYLKGDETVLPKGFVLSNEIKFININFDMNYIKQTVEIKNIKNNENDKKIYPKTSQSKRDVKFINTLNLNPNQGNDNLNIGGKNKAIRNNIKSKSINKQKIKNNIEKDLTKSKNKYNLKEFTELNKGTTKNVKYLEKYKKEQKEKENTKIMKTSKPEKKYKNNFIRNKSKEKLNSKSVGKTYIKSKTNTHVNENINTINKNNKEQKNINIQNAKIINNNKEYNLNNINNSKYKLSSQINKNKNQVIINNNIKNNILPKEELNLFNTFNYKDLESKENTLVVNQSNYNNASIPEIVDLDINNNTYLKNLENDINCGVVAGDIILLDKNNKNDENLLNNHEQMDSLIVEKIISDINDNKNERPYTPPLQKIIPVSNENNSNLNNINISQVNESLIQNHYCDLVYD